MKRKLEGLQQDLTPNQGKSSENELSILQHFHLTTVGSSLA
ncbi:MAG TPA: hypothetical protein V6D33_10455 [Cyanophyceae cyanobacterium]